MKAFMSIYSTVLYPHTINITIGNIFIININFYMKSSCIQILFKLFDYIKLDENNDFPMISPCYSPVISHI